jgi:hypothetical protein
MARKGRKPTPKKKRSTRTQEHRVAFSGGDADRTGVGLAERSGGRHGRRLPGRRRVGIEYRLLAEWGKEAWL